MKRENSSQAIEKKFTVNLIRDCWRLIQRPVASGAGDLHPVYSAAVTRTAIIMGEIENHAKWKTRGQRI